VKREDFETMPIRFSVVIPVFNEVDAIPTVAAEISEVMASLRGDYECIFVDDGSSDDTPRALEILSTQPGSRIRLVRTGANRGQGAALYLGLSVARGDLIVTMDGDGQNLPSDIPALVDTLERESLDVVCGIRAERRDSWLRVAMSRLANAVRARILHDGVHDSGCALKVMRRTVVPALLPVRTLYSFIPALAVSAGFLVGEQRVGHRARHGGRSNYGLGTFFWRPFVDMVGVKWYQTRCVLRPEDAAWTGPSRRASEH
jgi:glycosyltransferase involved in cell wall biosynthesis